VLWALLLPEVSAHQDLAEITPHHQYNYELILISLSPDKKYKSIPATMKKDTAPR